jgi:hypothetical protein
MVVRSLNCARVLVRLKSVVMLSGLISLERS